MGKVNKNRVEALENMENSKSVRSEIMSNKDRNTRLKTHPGEAGLVMVEKSVCVWGGGGGQRGIERNRDISDVIDRPIANNT